MQISPFVTAKRLLGRTLIGASLLVAGLQAGAASALSFNFEFSGFGYPTNPATVTGSVDGLIDNLNNQTTGLMVTIISATNGPSNIVFTDANYDLGDGFDVASGQVTGVNIKWTSGVLRLYLGNQGDFGPQYTNFNFNNADFQPSSSNSLVFTPSSQEPVPGALPIFGAGAAFGWSRRLRRRIKTTI
jgi:hypothetical protein